MQKNDALALMWLGMFEEEEWKNHPSNLAKAEEYYLQSGQSGHPLAYKSLAHLYEEGIGRTIDLEKAEQFYLLAAENGVISAYTDIAEMHINGAHMDLQKAKKYYLLAAENGDAAAYMPLVKIF